MNRWPWARALGAGLIAWVAASWPAQAAAHAFDTAELRAPRASFVDVPALTEALRSAARHAQISPPLPPRTDCASAAPVMAPSAPMQIPSRYLSGAHGAVNPAYGPSVELYRNFEDTAARLANLYVAYADASYAHCLVNHLHRWAHADALTDYATSTAKGASNQAWFQVGWTASAAALALSQVVHEPALDASRLNSVITWLHRVSRQQIAYSGGEFTCCNNHAWWRGLHATMVGVLANDPALYRWGLGRYALAIEQLAADGRWPLEMARHELALHYQNFALLPLVMIAEIAGRQGLNLYAYKRDGRDLHSAVNFLARTWANPASWPALGLPPQDLRAFAPGRGDQTWGAFYRARFGRDPLNLLGSPAFNPRTGGDSALLAYRPEHTQAGSARAAAVARTGERIDLRPWKLQLPDAAASEVGPVELASGYKSPHFEVEAGGTLLFTAPVGGGTTRNAKYTRSELREMLDPADKANNWTTYGRHTMSLRQEVVRPPGSGRVVVFQIHAIQPDGGHAPPLVKAQWRDGTLEFLVKARAHGGKDVRYGAKVVPVGQAYDAALDVHDGRLTMRVDDTTFVHDFATRDPRWLALRYYFKAGNYPQDNKPGPDNVSVVRIHDLTVKHTPSAK